MKKLSILAGFLVLALSMPVKALDLRIQGTTLAFFSQDDSNVINGVGGPLGQITGGRLANQSDFAFALDEIELGLTQEFGDAASLNVELDFSKTQANGRFGLSFNGGGVDVEQAYISLGAGGNWKLGIYTAPFGYYANDRGANISITYSSIYKRLTPTEITGLEYAKDFENGHTIQVGIANNLYNNAQFGVGTALGSRAANDSNYPAGYFRYGFNWGEEDRKSVIGISYGITNELAGNDDDFWHLITADMAFYFGESSLLAGEMVYGYFDLGATNASVYGINLIYNYDFSNAWNIFVKGDWFADPDAFYGVDENELALSLGVGYEIAENLNVKLEAGAELHLYDLAGADNSWSYFGAAALNAGF